MSQDALQSDKKFVVQTCNKLIFSKSGLLNMHIQTFHAILDCVASIFVPIIIMYEAMCFSVENSFQGHALVL